jgi:tRNA A37 threonylcarbamoyladenosine modification protein TsaB
MLELYFSLSSHRLLIALEENNQCLINIQKKNIQLHTENFLTYLKKVLSYHNHSLPSLEKIYFTSNPSNKTGLKVSLTFILTIQILNPQVKIYHIDTLLLQAGESNCISILTIDRQEKRFYFSVYKKRKKLLSPIITNHENLKKLIQEFSSFPVKKDFYRTNF